MLLTFARPRTIVPPKKSREAESPACFQTLSPDRALKAQIKRRNTVMLNRLFKRPSDVSVALAAAIAVLALGGVSIAVRATLVSRPTAAAETGQPSAATALESQKKHARATVPSHVLVLRPNGFEPAEVRWPKERFFLAVENHTDARELKLVLSRENGNRVHDFTRKMRKERGLGILDLPPGEYFLSEANHPKWVCRITITPG
jgi:hypothetical protein